MLSKSNSSRRRTGMYFLSAPTWMLKSFKSHGATALDWPCGKIQKKKKFALSNSLLKRSRQENTRPGMLEGTWSNVRFSVLQRHTRSPVKPPSTLHTRRSPNTTTFTIRHCSTWLARRLSKSIILLVSTSPVAPSLCMARPVSANRRLSKIAANTWGSRSSGSRAIRFLRLAITNSREWTFYRATIHSVLPSIEP